jgi:hypothetical protein
VGRATVPSVTGFRHSLMALDASKPLWGEGIEGVDWARVNRSYSIMFPSLIAELIARGDGSPELRNWQIVYSSFLNKNYPRILRTWKSGAWHPEYPLEYAIIAEAIAEAGDARAMKWCELLSRYWPVDAKVILGRYFWRKGEVEKAYQVFEAAFLEYRKTPWAHEIIMENSLNLVAEMAMNNKEIGARFFDLLLMPFSVYNLNERRLFTLLTISSTMDCEHAAEVLEFMEPDVPFKKKVLEYRQRCYEEIGSSRLKQARLDLQEFNHGTPAPFTADFSEF